MKSTPEQGGKQYKRLRERADYTMQYACFDCRKVFKQAKSYFPTAQQASREHLCPDCSKPMNLMGTAFRAPRRNDFRRWRHVAELALKGFTFSPNQGIPEALK